MVCAIAAIGRKSGRPDGLSMVLTGINLGIRAESTKSYSAALAR